MKIRGLFLLGMVMFGLHAGIVEVAAQQSSETSQGGEYRRYIFAAAGAALFGGLALLGGEGHDESPCSSTACLLSVGGAAGGLAGYMLGSDLDAAAASRRVAGPTLDRNIREIEVPGPPFRIRRLPDAGLAILQDDAISLSDGGTSLTTPIVGLRPRDLVSLPARQALAIASYTGLYIFPRGSADTLRLLETEPVTAISTLDGEALALGGRELLRRVTIGIGAEDYSIATESEATLSGVPQAITNADGGPLWLLADSVLMSRDPATLDSIGGVLLGGVGGDLAADGPLALIALGSSGAVLVDISDPASPAVISTLQDMRTAAGVALDSSIGYVAAASQGLLVYDFSDPGSPALLGAVPDLGQTVAVEVMGGSVYVADRTGSRVLRIDLPRPGGR